jgi:AcrR family transcriptional regulator
MADQQTAPAAKRATGDTRDRLLQAARDAFSALGYLGTRVDDIVRRAGTSHGTFYTYFKDKKAVLVGLTTEIAHSLYGSALAPHLDPDEVPTPRDLVRARIASFLDVYRRHWGIMRSWTQAEGMHPDVEQAKSRIRRAIAVAVAELLHRDQQRGLISVKLRPDFLATALVAMTEGFANERFATGIAITDRDLDDLTDLWVRGVYATDLAAGPPPTALGTG